MTCQLDPVPTWLVKEMRELLSQFITVLCNKSLVTLCFPSEFKQAIVRPLLKKSGLDATDLKNYRPVSNLSFLSKLLERVVESRLQVFLDSNELMPSQQSAYRQHHNTETEVLKVYNDLLVAADSGLVSTVCLLDLTAAFDTVEHDLLILRLERQFGLHSVTLLWFRSYLCGRSYHVSFAGAASRTVFVACSVPQGSVLGLRLFIMYSADLADKAEEHDVNFHGCADNTQLYVHCRPEEIAATSAKQECCITDMEYWMSANRLRLNMDKTELLWAGTRYHVSTLNDSSPSLQLSNVTVDASQHVRVLGVHLSSDLSLDKHVSSVSATCFHLCQLRHIRRSLDADSAATLLHAFVTSRVDYCNAYLAVAPRTTTDRLQRVLNAAARVISDTRKFDHRLSRLILVYL